MTLKVASRNKLITLGIILCGLLMILGISIYMNNISSESQQVNIETTKSSTNKEITTKIIKDIENLEKTVNKTLLGQSDVLKLKQKLMSYLEKKDMTNAEKTFLEYKALIETKLNEVTHTSTTETTASFSQKEIQTVSMPVETKELPLEHHDAQVVDVPTIEEYKIIVNKKHPLSETYHPGECAVAKQAFLKLKEEMQHLGFAVSDHYSGYRSYEDQEQLYDNYVAKDGKEVADRYSARPGYSEHQTGLVFDMIDTSGQLLGEGIQDGATKWLSKNAHRYGFVVRYLYGKEDITGYMPEPWHLRFVGNDAMNIYNEGLTLEEYYHVEGGGYTE